MPVGLYTSSRAFRRPMTKDNLMNNSIFDINTLISEFSPPSSIVADIEILCQNLEKMFAGQPANLTLFAAALPRVMEWAAIRTHAEDSSAAVVWRARYAGLPKLGGTLTCQNIEQEFMLSLDSSSTVYLGSWRSLRSGDEELGGIFSIEDSSGGRVLVLDTGLTKQKIQIPNSDGLNWGSIAGLLTGSQDLELIQPDVSESQLFSVPPQDEPPNVTLPSDAAPTILARPARQQKAPVTLPTENSDRKATPVIQPEMTQPDGWLCTCGNKNAGQFCLKCGREKPTQTGVEKSKPAQPTVCKQCGGVLSTGAKFCRRCGSEVRE